MSEEKDYSQQLIEDLRRHLKDCQDYLGKEISRSGSLLGHLNKSEMDRREVLFQANIALDSNLALFKELLRSEEIPPHVRGRIRDASRETLNQRSLVNSVGEDLDSPDLNEDQNSGKKEILEQRVSEILDRSNNARADPNDSVEQEETSLDQKVTEAVDTLFGFGTEGPGESGDSRFQNFCKPALSDSPGPSDMPEALDILKRLDKRDSKFGIRKV